MNDKEILKFFLFLLNRIFRFGWIERNICVAQEGVIKIPDLLPVMIPLGFVSINMRD